jgi:hypothetical protein
MWEIMKLKACEYYGEAIANLYQDRQRFCSIDCGNRWFALERRQAVARFRAEGIEVVVADRPEFEQALAEREGRR